MARQALEPGKTGAVSASKQAHGGWRARTRLGVHGGRTVQVTATGTTNGATDALQAKLATLRAGMTPNE